jgi:PAP2 superfamily
MGDIIVYRPAALVRLFGLIRQLIIILGLEKIYEVSRGIIPQQANQALHNGLIVVNLEKSLHIFNEWRIQQVVLRHAQWHFGPVTLGQDAIISLVNHFYLHSQFVFTPLFLIWLYLSHRHHFRFVRDVIFITTGLALVIYIVFPMMPPRLLTGYMRLPSDYHIQDTLAPLLNDMLQQTQIGYNPYAAMPSLHFAWALILGATLVLIGRTLLLRVLGLLYPFMMLATILISGNHLWLDAVGSVIVVIAAVVLAWALHRQIGIWDHVPRAAHRRRRWASHGP